MHKDDCKNCGEQTHTPDDRTGLIHVNGLYACFYGKKRMDTVAETE